MPVFYSIWNMEGAREAGISGPSCPSLENTQRPGSRAFSSAKRDPRTGEYDKIYCFWYADHEGKGHWKTVGRHSKGVRPATVRKERVKFLAEFDATGINPIERDKVTIGEIVNAYLAWGRTKGSTLTGLQPVLRPPQGQNPRFAYCRSDSEFAFQPQGAAFENAYWEYKAQKGHQKA